MNKEDYRSALISEINCILDKCSVKLLEYLLDFSRHAQKVSQK